MLIKFFSNINIFKTFKKVKYLCKYGYVNHKILPMLSMIVSQLFLQFQFLRNGISTAFLRNVMQATFLIIGN